MKKFYLRFILLSLLCVLCAPMAWGQTYNGGTWYSLYSTDTHTNTTFATDFGEYTTVFAPVSTESNACGVSYKKYSWASVDGTLQVYNSSASGSYTEVIKKSGISDYKKWNKLTFTPSTANISKIKFRMSSGTGLQVKDIMLPLAKHILIDDGTTYGTTDYTPATSFATTILGQESHYTINLRSFLVSKSITITSSNSQFSFAGKSSKTITLQDNYCASKNGTSGAKCGTGTLGDIAQYAIDVTFSPTFVGVHSTVITITDGKSTAYVRLSANGAPQKANLPDGDYVLRHVATGKYLGGANNLGTQASLIEHGTFFTLTKQSDGTYTLDSHVGDGTSHFLNGSLYVNGASQNWAIYQSDDEFFLTPNGTNFLGGTSASSVLNTNSTSATENANKWQILTRAQLIAELEAGSKNDATFLISNPNFSRYDNHGGWEYPTGDGVDFTLSDGYSYDRTSWYYQNFSCESYHALFVLGQTLRDVPNGKYQLTVQGFYRQDGSDNDNLPYFYMNDKRNNLMLLSGADNSMMDAGKSFDQGKYKNTPIEVVVKDNAIILGVANEHNTNLWCIWDNFELKYLGADYELIVWEQSLKGYTEDDVNLQIDLTATVKNQRGKDMNRAIIYTSSDDQVASISGNKLIVHGIGTAVITATSGELVETRTIRVRANGEPCGTYALEVSAQQTISVAGKTQNFVLAGPGDLLTFKANCDILGGLMSLFHSLVGTAFFYPEVSADGSSWTRLAELAITTTATTYGPYDIPEGTKYVRFSLNASSIYTYVNDIVVTQKSYLTIDGEASATWNVSPDAFTYQTVQHDFVINYSDVSSLRLTHTNSNVDIQYEVYNASGVRIQDFDNDCGDYGTYTLRVLCMPTVAGAYSDDITIAASSGKSVSVHVSGNALAYEYNNTGNWNNASNWTGSTLPGENVGVVIYGQVTITEPVTVAGMTISENAKVYIAPTGGLTVGRGGISGSTASNLICLSANSETTDNNCGQTGYLKISPEYKGDMPTVSIQLFSIGYYDSSSDEENIAAWQYVGTPIATGSTVKSIYKNAWVSRWDEENDSWLTCTRTYVMTPFVGYVTTQDLEPNGRNYTYSGQLVSNQTNVSVPLSYHVHGDGAEDDGFNMLANSFSAPIDVTQFDEADFVGDVEKTIYLYNTGSRSQWLAHQASNVVARSGEQGTSAGQYVAIPVGSASVLARMMGYASSTVIAPMQGFRINATGEGASLRLNYSNLVWNGSQANQPMRIAQRNPDELVTLKVTLSSNDYADDLYLLASHDYVADFENGTDARKLTGGLFNVFAIEDTLQLSVDARPTLAGTRIGLHTGDMTDYMLTFSHLGESMVALHDLATDSVMPITEGATYSFTALPNTLSSTRFVIEEYQSDDNWKVTTDLDELSTSHIYQEGNNLILTGVGNATLRLVDASGKLILSQQIANAAMIDLSMLHSGVYVAWVGNETVKVIR